MHAILVVDDDFSVRKGIALMLKGEGFTVYEAQNERDAIALAANHKVDLAVVDVFLGDEDGVALADQLRKGNPATAIVLMSAHGESEKVSVLRSASDGKYLDKSELATSLVASIRRLLH